MQRYQPPHARRQAAAPQEQQRQQRPSYRTGPDTGAASVFDSGAVHAGPPTAPITTDFVCQRGLTAAGSRPRHQSWANDLPSGPRDGSASRSAREGLGSSGPSDTNETNKYAPRPSRKDWSAQPGSTSGAQVRTPRDSTTRDVGWNRGSVLASPASDIKPMRTPTPSNTVSQLAKDRAREMEMLQSVSRSGGDGAEGDALKNWETQDKYRDYIDERIHSHYSKFPGTRDTTPQKQSTEELESLSSIVLLFRKLREGVIASSRIDKFAIEVFESSALYAILSSSRPQLVSALSGLVPGLYRACDTKSGASISSFVDDEKAQNMSARFEGLSVKDEVGEDRRAMFASLLLLYQLVVLGQKDFWTTYFELTNPTVKTLRTPLGPSGSPLGTPSPQSEPGVDSLNSSSPLNPTDKAETISDLDQRPFVHPSRLEYASKAAAAISTHRFSPITCFRLLSPEGGGSAYERHILSWALEGVRNRAWEMLKKSYMSSGEGWAIQVLGLGSGPAQEAGELKGQTVKSNLGSKLNLARWIEERGVKVENGVVKYR